MGFFDGFKRGPYSGRLAFDGEHHIDPKGRKVVTDDYGMTWRYARKGDPSHVARYQKRVLVVDTTANQADPEPHHWGVQPDDAHANGLVFHTDVDGPTVTGHTAAYA